MDLLVLVLCFEAQLDLLDPLGLPDQMDLLALLSCLQDLLDLGDQVLH